MSLSLKKEIGNYIVYINDGNLNHSDNHWYYGVIIDKFDNHDKWIINKCFYIKGHKDNCMKEKSLMYSSLEEWFKNLAVKDVDEMMTKKRNFVFEI